MRLSTASVFALALTVGGCAGPPRLMHGDANGAQVEYDGFDLDAATAVAKRHCARYERVPHYLDTALNVAWYDCVRP